MSVFLCFRDVFGAACTQDFVTVLSVVYSSFCLARQVICGHQSILELLLLILMLRILWRTFDNQQLVDFHRPGDLMPLRNMFEHLLT